ncbi:MAG: hypothetical protein KGL25_14045 [Gammaproteobacteria bacterium]|nr:hypothetical protein [Gammaproteobacteria bacterium]MDE2252516.1 hypothetical protein [Gammaproteobacteria bacterium]
MNANVLTAALALSVLCGNLATAETMVVDDQVMVRPSTVDRPARGVTMAAVEAKFGAPQTRHPAVGKPPITRWDYAGFSVFFEGERVIDAVAVAP